LGSSYTTNFHDIKSGSNGTYTTQTGFDLVTGWGSPNGTGLLNTLAP
jgi:kumamolisin